MDIQPFIYRTVSNAYFLLKGFKSPQVYKFLNRSQWWPPEKIRDFQNQELRKLIEYVYEYIPYYRKIMKEKGLKPKDIQTVEDLVKFPILNKENFRKNRKNLVSTKIKFIKNFIRKTGGSSGEPLQIINDYTNNAWERAAFNRGLGFTGYRPGESMVELFGGTLGLAPEKKIDKLKAKFSGSIFLLAFEINKENINKYFEKIKDSRVRFLRGYTSAIYLLAKLMEEAQLNISLQAVFPTAETLFDFQRKQIEKTFHCQVFNQYGCGEENSIAFECPSHKGLHVTDENVIIESLRNGKRVIKEKMGNATLTTLHNFAMPLVRYQNGDVIALSLQPCLCGRSLSRITKIYGRTNDLLVTRDGRLISATFLPSYCVNAYLKGVQQFQVIQEMEGMIRLKVVKNRDFTDNELNSLFKILHKYLGDIKIEVEYVASIPLTPQNKHKYVISKISDKLLCK